MRLFVGIFLFSIFTLKAQVPTTFNDFFLPGSQPLQSGDLGNPAGCNCHDYDPAIDQVFNWEGSMMAHAAKDLLYLATMTIANQDADSSGDLCLRCHTPTGWLSGRSDDPSGGLLTDEDRTSVNCLFCHRSLMPSAQGVNPYPLDANYINPDCTSTGNSTYLSDSTYMYTLSHIPPTTANGMFVVTDEDERRGPYATVANPNHGYYYSTFHKESDICGTCHDVSNPVYNNNGDGTYSLNALDTPAPDFDPYAMFPIERTYSEWSMSDYNTPSGVYAPQFGGNKNYVSTCQDCHMRDVTGKGCTRGSADIRNDLPLHDMTGGNTFMPAIVATQYPSLVNSVALDSGVSRATRMLQLAATLEVTAIFDSVYVTVTNETGHKLPSGYPEGRRIWLNVQAYDATDALIYESGHYDPSTGILTKDSIIKIYEIKPGLTPATALVVGDTAGPSFHFVLNDTIYKDNRIPPRGFTNANFEAIQSQPFGYSYEDGQYWDETTYAIPNREMPDSVVVTLYYQTTSKEYIEFLRDENITDSRGTDMYNLWVSNGRSAPVIMARSILGTNDISLAVGLVNFQARIINKGVLLEWQTASEIENQGFEIYRSQSENGNYELISSYLTNKDLIGQGNSSSTSQYSFIDETAVVDNTYWYKLADININGGKTYHGSIAITVNKGQNGIPEEFQLSQNYPNPFNPETRVNVGIPDEQKIGEITIDVYDIMGQKVKTLFKGNMEPGYHTFSWNGIDDSGKQVSAGTYFYYLKSNKFHQIKKMIFLK